MGYNISETSGQFAGSGTAGVDIWTTTADLSDPSVTVVTGDFDRVTVPGGTNLGEAADGYTFSPLSTDAYGTLSYNTTDGTFTFTIDRQAVIQSGSDQTVSFTITGTDGARSDTDTVIIEILICVARGTLIETPDGTRFVESLSPGDMITTWDGDARPVRWAGMRRVTAAELHEHPELRPIRISAGALGHGRPERDLLVSPQHHVLVEGWAPELLFGEPEVLAPAAGLLDLPGVSREAAGQGIDYVHLLFDRHQIIFTEGAPTESFYPGPWSFAAIGRDNAADIVSRVPAARSPDAYGATARPRISSWEARTLVRYLNAGRMRDSA